MPSLPTTEVVVLSGELRRKVTAPNPVVRAFIQSTREAVEGMTVYDFVCDAWSVGAGAPKDADIYASMKFDGDDAGGLVISMTRGIAELLVAAMLGLDEDEVSDDLLDGIEEFTNIVAGGARTRLEHTADAFALAIPLAEEARDVVLPVFGAIAFATLHCRIGMEPFDVTIWKRAVDAGG